MQSLKKIHAWAQMQDPLSMSLIYSFIFFYDLSSRLTPKYHRHNTNTTKPFG